MQPFSVGADLCVRPFRGRISRCAPAMVDICYNISIEDQIMTSQKLPPVHPGEILLEEYLKPLGISQNKLGRDLNVPAQRINEIVRGQRTITVDTALRLARYFQTSPQFWLNLQARYDLEMAEETRLLERVIREVREREAV